MPRLAVGLLPVLVLLTSCTLPGAGQVRPHLAATAGGTTPRPSSLPSPAAGTPAVVMPGHVYGLQGEPVAGVTVRAYLVTDAGSGLITDYGSGIIANHGGGVVANNGSNALATSGGSLSHQAAASFQVLDATGPIEATTGDDGAFQLALPPGRKANIEAVKASDLKALVQGAASTAGLDLHLAYTGTISGHVSVPDDATVTDFEGVDVFVPGVPYSLKTDRSGAFTLTGVPVGTYTLVASKDGLGRAEATGVAVVSRQDTKRDLALHVDKPSLGAIAPANGAPGQAVTITGQNLGASTGTPFTVAFGGAAATTLTRKDNNTIVATVPPGASNGQVTVTVGGLTSNGLAFKVIKSVAITPRVAYLLPGQAQAYSIYALDTDGKPVEGAVVDWRVDAGFGKVAAGVVTATAAGQGTLTAGAGALQDTLALQAAAAKVVVNTFAGTHTAGFTDGDAAHAVFNTPLGLAFDPKGNLMAVDGNGNVIRRVTPFGVVTTLAGAANKGTDDGPGLQARFSQPNYVAFDADGNAFVADYGNSVVRRIAPDGTVSTYAGSGVAGEVDGRTTSASFDHPKGVAVDAHGIVYVSDTGSGAAGGAIRKIAKDGTVTTFVGGGAAGFQDGRGTQALFDRPAGLTFDGAGNLYVADSANNAIRKVTPDGTVTTLVGGQAAADAAASDAPASPAPAGILDGDAHTATLLGPTAVLFGPDGALYETESGSNSVRRISLDGHVTTLVGGHGAPRPDGTLAGGVADGFDAQGQLNGPNQLAFDAAGRLYVADRFGDRIRVITFAAP